jgi:hypothetical protein
MKLMKRNTQQKKVIENNEDRTRVYQVTPPTLSMDVHDRLPLELQTKKPIAPMSQPGYYPGYSTLSQQAFWDEATRNVVLQRVQHVPSIRFFSPEQAELMQAVCDRLLPQDDRDEEHKIPIVNYIDKRLYEGEIDGYRYEDMPPEREAMLMGLHAIDAIARHMYQKPFLQIGPREQDEVLRTIHQNKPPAAHDIWERMSAHHFWALIMQDTVRAYYAHPYAWDEIGFGGPAYPRGYMRLNNGKPEPWEVEEQRYDWIAPPTSISDQYEPVGGPEGHAHHSIGQGGTH